MNGIAKKTRIVRPIAGIQPLPKTNLSKMPTPNPTMVAMSRITPLQCHRIVAPLAQPVSSPAAALAATAQGNRGPAEALGLTIPKTLLANTFRRPIIALATRHRLPAIRGPRDFVVHGGLVSYRNDLAGN
jgi:hypothetical protein